jgi:ribose 5-phosphate isomerase A
MSTSKSSPNQRTQDDLKQAAAIHAAQQVSGKTIVGLGSGSTARLVVAAIGKRVREEGLQIIGIPTSEQTGDQAKSLGIPLSTLGEYPEVDVTIDGADEVELGLLNLIKGGGGNLLREKIVASASKRLVIVVDESKLVKQLGSHGRVPVEVAQFGWQSTAKAIEKLKADLHLRMAADGKPFITDGGNYILDCDFGPIASSEGLQRSLDDVVGVVEHGLFIGMTSMVVIGTDAGVKEMTPQN